MKRTAEPLPIDRPRGTLLPRPREIGTVRVSPHDASLFERIWGELRREAGGS